MNLKFNTFPYILPQTAVPFNFAMVKFFARHLTLIFFSLPFNNVSKLLLSY